MLFTDWNRSGTPALRVSNDREYYKGGQEQLWHVEPGKPPVLYTEAEGWKPLRIWGMGIASYDLDRDGYPEYFLTSMADNKLQTLAPPAAGQRRSRPTPTSPLRSGVTAHRPYTGDDLKPSTAWHAQFEDVNNDGLADLFIAKGNVGEDARLCRAAIPTTCCCRADGKFVEVGDKAGVASGAISRGAALVDFNLDGLLDLVVVNRWENAQLWRNTSTNAGHWLEVGLRQDGAEPRRASAPGSRSARGSAIQRREITVGGGHASGQHGWWHFGLGNFAQAEVRVIWPDGTQGDWQRLEAGKFHVLERGKPPVEWPVN